MPPSNNKSMMMNTRPGRIGSDSNESETLLNNLWVSNLANDVADSDLMDLFAQYGALDSVTSYSSRSYAFVFLKRIEVRPPRIPYNASISMDTLSRANRTPRRGLDRVGPRWRRRSQV
nr:isoform 2 of flowering time control protein fpa [Quercus suber]